MIRVGDVYSDNTKMTHNCTITFISRYTVNVLCANGGMFTFGNNPMQEADFLRNRKLIAEYPTWQEAVNSKEFKGEWVMINIQDITPFMKKGWVAMDEDGTWLWYDHKPVLGEEEWELNALTGWSGNFILNCIFDIAPADDWTKSLIKVGEK